MIGSNPRAGAPAPGAPQADDAAADDARARRVAAQAARARRGRSGEDRALRHLQARGLRLVARNYRAGQGRSRHGGEIDLILRERDGTLVFVEVRTRGAGSAGGAAASVGAAKRARILYAARHYLARLERVPPCRFDVVAVDDGRVQWLQAAFDAE
jgi:putative endonuclease